MKLRDLSMSAVGFRVLDPVLHDRCLQILFKPETAKGRAAKRNETVLKIIIAVQLLCLGLMQPSVARASADQADPGTLPRACVILLHGLCRSGRSMRTTQRHLEKAGYAVINLDYDATAMPIQAIAASQVARTVNDCRDRGLAPIHFVTHSMGGLVVRAYLQDHELPAGSRVVMLAPPNQGSELADAALTHAPGLFSLGGPAAGQLSTLSRTVQNGLKPVAAEIGIIAGSVSFNPLCSYLLPGKDDGRVSVMRARLPEMRDFIVVKTNHTLILWDKNVCGQVLYFLRTGTFSGTG